MILTESCKIRKNERILQKMRESDKIQAFKFLLLGTFTRKHASS